MSKGCSFIFFALLWTLCGAQMRGGAPAPAPAGGATWCVAKENATADALQRATAWACTEGSVDCRQVGPNGVCKNISAWKTTSFIYNSYYIQNPSDVGRCYFNATAMLTHLDPSIVECRFPSAANGTQFMAFGPSPRRSAGFDYINSSVRLGNYVRGWVTVVLSFPILFVLMIV
ncbi:unnamed protein product [Cuscuta campestris]|uniref:X8 domain-containing protein n=1 Tax=Cuscuta campestris TaxID=132261 RepID=A0A484MVE0_9ASTE|nr:unnamed protein product [Cuscuta campestris]